MTITTTVTEGIATIWLDRPDKLNAVTPEMAEMLASERLKLNASKDVRVIVVRGRGTQAFSVGSDIDALSDFDTPWAFRNRTDYASQIRGLRAPVLALLDGWVLGGGLEIALAADIRIATSRAKLGLPEVRLGWVPGGGATQFLPRLIGYGQAMRLLLSGEPIDAAEASTIGLVEEVVEASELEARGHELAERIAAHHPVATQTVKAAVRSAIGTGLDTGLAHENDLMVLSFALGHSDAGIEQFRGKRQADQQ